MHSLSQVRTLIITPVVLPFKNHDEFLFSPKFKDWTLETHFWILSHITRFNGEIAQ
jgi:hypothetical protein